MRKIRVAQYLRVSHEEQAKHGFSIATQKKHLDDFIKDNKDMILYDVYADEGISADKLKKRADLQRLLNDVKDGKIDLIIFTKLDRWFRSVAKYYKIQEILETNNVSWQATLEDYETITANGKFKVNIMLSVAQQERDKTSERIRDVFDYKVKNGEAIVPSNATPFGFTTAKVDGKNKIVHDLDTERQMYDLIQHYYTYKSKKKTMYYMFEKYEIRLDYQSISNLLKNPLLYGCYRGIENYCDGYMDKVKFDEIQEFLTNNRRERGNDRVYLFSSLIKCPFCEQQDERHMVGMYTTSKYKDKTYHAFSYRCENAYSKLTCTNKKIMGENKLEKQLLEKLKMFAERNILEFETKEPKQVKKKDERQAIKDEMKRLNKMYQKNRMSDEEYDEEFEKLEIALANVKDDENTVKDVTRLKDLLEVNILELYETFTREEKQAFWSGLIRHIYLELVDGVYKVRDIDFL